MTNPALCVAKEFSESEILKSLVEYGNLTVAEIADSVMTMKEKKLKQFLNLDKKIKTTKNGRYYIHVGASLVPVFGREMFIAKDRLSLINKLYDAVFGERIFTLRDGYTLWQEYRREIGTNTKTIKENDGDWNRFLAKSSLADKEIKKIRAIDIKDFFMVMTKDRKVTYKRLGGAKSILNGIMIRCIELGKLEHNCVEEVDYSYIKKRCKPEKQTKRDYTDEEKELIMNWLRKQEGVYEKAILFAFNVFMRIGEIVPIKYEDVKNGYLYVNRSVAVKQDISTDENGKLRFDNWHYETEDRIKGNTEDGFRYIPLNKESMDIIEKLHNTYPDNEYVFMYEDRKLNPNTFNRHLKKACEAVGIEYRSSHQIRFTNASKLFNNNVNIEMLSAMMGHSNTATTMRYLRKKEPTPEVADKVRKALTV